MKRQVRIGVFETNSSMTHSLTICTEEDFDKWEKGELLFDRYSDKLINASDIKEDDEDDPQYITQDMFYDDEYLESFTEYFTTPSGDRMVAFGNYGNDY